MKLNKEKFLKSELGGNLQECVTAWDHWLTELRKFNIDTVGQKYRETRKAVSRVANGREIVTKVDMVTYENRVTSRKRVSELKSAMDVRINKLQRMAVLEMFSEKDPEMKALLDEYKALTEQKGEVQKDGE